MKSINRVMNISTLEIIKASACVAIGWYAGRGVYSLAVELVIKAFERLSRLIA